MRTPLPIGPRTLAFVALIVVAELLLYHVGNYGKWVVQERDAVLGWRMLPDQNGWSREYDVRERINSSGYRDREWETAQQARAARESTFRVAVVGNSITYGSGVAIEDTWPRELERLLRVEFERRGDQRRVVVMNFACQGYVFEQMARVFETQIEDYQPDLLIVPSLPPDIRPMPPPNAPADYPLREWVVRTSIYEMLQDRVIDRWIPPPERSQPLPTGMQLKQLQMQAMLPSMRARLFELFGETPPAWVAFEPGQERQAAGDEAGAAAGRAQRLWSRLEVELWRAVLPVAPTQLPGAVWEVLDSEVVQKASQELERDLRLDLFRELEDHWVPSLRKQLDSPIMDTPWIPAHRFWWWKMAARLERILKQLDQYGGKLSIVTVTRLHEVLDQNLPAEQQNVKPVDLFWEQWLPGQAARRAERRLFYTSTRQEFSSMQPDVTRALIEHGYLVGPRGTKRIDPELPGAQSSLFLFHDVGHFSARGHAVYAELLARSLFSQGL